jgi:hypothetical protein
MFSAGGMRSIKKSKNFIGNRTRDFPDCGIVPQPTTLPRAPGKKKYIFKLKKKLEAND